MNVAMGGDQFQIALICPAPDHMAGWMKRLAERICTAPGLQLCALIEPDPPIETKSALGPWWQIESKFVAREVAAACPTFDQVQADLPRLNARQDQAPALTPDIIIDLTAGQGRDAIGRPARLGIWWLDFLGEVQGARSVSAILQSDRLMRIGLVQTTDDAPQPHLIAEATLNTKFMAARNHLYACEKSITLIMRELAKLRQSETLPAPLPEPPVQDKTPSLGCQIRYGAQLVRNVAARVIEKAGIKAKLRPGFFYLQTTTADPLQLDPNAMTVHPIPGNVYYADPFLWTQAGETYCFFEIYDYATGHGHLGAGRLDDGKLKDVRSIIQCDYHMSFPFLFEHEGELYMLPETCGAERIEIWKCVEFPYRWEHYKIVLDNIMAADSCVAQVGDDWWLFTNASDDVFGELNSELHLYKANGPMLDSLEPHPLNPVVFDSRTARNGGRVFAMNGHLYRAAQRNSHGRYGYGLNLIRIDYISMTGYEETLVRRIDGDFRKGAIGCHHIDHRDGLTVIDVRLRMGGWPPRDKA